MGCGNIDSGNPGTPGPQFIILSFGFEGPEGYVANVRGPLAIKNCNAPWNDENAGEMLSNLSINAASSMDGPKGSLATYIRIMVDHFIFLQCRYP